MTCTSSVSSTTSTKRTSTATQAGRSTIPPPRPAPPAPSSSSAPPCRLPTLATSVLRTLRDLNPKQPARRVPPDPIARRSRQLAAPLLHAARRRLRYARPASRRARHLRRHLLLRHAPNPGDRHPHGSRRQRRLVQRQVLVGTLRLALIGVFLGAVASLATAKLIASLLFATSPWDGGNLHRHGHSACSPSPLSPATFPHAAPRASVPWSRSVPTELTTSRPQPDNDPRTNTSRQHLNTPWGPHRRRKSAWGKRDEGSAEQCEGSAFCSSRSPNQHDHGCPIQALLGWESTTPHTNLCQPQGIEVRFEEYGLRRLRRNSSPERF